MLELFPGSELERERTDVHRAAEVLACSLGGTRHVIGRWWPSAPIKRGLARGGITDETVVIDAALELLGVQVRRQGATGASWRLDRVPERFASEERVAECGCDQRPRDWRLKTGGPRQCGMCHPPAEGIEVEWSGAEP